MSGRETWSDAQLAVERAEEEARVADVDERRQLEAALRLRDASGVVLYGYGVHAEVGHLNIKLDTTPLRHTIGAGPGSHSERWWALQRWAERADADLRARYPWHESLPEVQDWRERVLGPQRRRLGS